MNTPAKRPAISATAAIYGISPDAVKVTRGKAEYGQDGYIYLHIVDGDVWLALGHDDADLATEAAALRKLAGLATAAADELEGRTAAQVPGRQGSTS